ncbi:MAG: nuclear transport factor 2 family protein [Rhizobiaceae bacterium]|nr:nuclear transport factor 2 family protein [Rhizobiaceae bacterium]
MNQAVKTGEPVRLSQTEQDVFDVKQVMIRYVWSLDMSDWKTLRSVFADDVVFDASNMGHYEGADNLVKEFQNRTPRTPVRRHVLVSPYVTVDGDTAEFTSYLINVRVRPGAPGGDYYWGTGYYRNSFRRTPQGWKMYRFRWEAILLEGNTQMIPSAGPMIYLPVMKGPADATWGGASKPGDRAFLSNSRQVEDLVVGLVRAADAGVAKDVEASLAGDARASFGATRLAGAKAIADWFCSPDRGRWRSTFLSNMKTSVSGDRAIFGAYAYMNVAGEGDKAGHRGGVLTVEAVRGGDGWKVADLAYVPLWDRDEKITRDRADEAGVRGLPKKVWSLEGEREPLRDEEELVALMSRYTWCYDLNDFETMLDVFHPDLDSSFHMGGDVYNLGRDATLAMIGTNRSKVPHSQHHVYNFDVEMGLDGNSAFVKCYSMTRRTPEGGGDVTMASGMYVMHARRYDGQWKFDTFRYIRAHSAYH